MVTKKKAVKKAPVAKKLHVVMGDGGSIEDFESACANVKMTKSQVARLLIESFINGVIKITPVKVKQTKAIRAK